MNLTPEQFSKLPKWAQNEISRLDADNIYYKEQLDQIAGKEETNVYVRIAGENKPLPKDSKIEFVPIMGVKNRITFRILDDGAIDVHGDAWDSHQNLIILPRMSNSFHVKFSKV